jgi:carbon monoxide dehydrogenase subunit G
MPGAQLQEVEGDEYRGIVKVKVGPITAQYKGAATFVEKDEENLRATLRAEGRDTRGQGNANATITAKLTPDGDGTKVIVITDLTVTGKVAQFGRGVMADVSAKLLDQFVECLETKVLAEQAAAPPAPAATQAPATPSGARRVESAEAQPIDLLDTAGGSVAKRAAPVLGVIAILWLLRVLIRRRKK